MTELNKNGDERKPRKDGSERKKKAKTKKKTRGLKKVHTEGTKSIDGRLYNRRAPKPELEQALETPEGEEVNFTEQLIKKEHTVISISQIKALTDSYLSTMKLDPLNCLMQSISNEENPILSVHHMAFSLLRLLVMQATSRMGTRQPVNCKGLPVYPLTSFELTEFTKLANTVINSKNVLINVRKQKHVEKESKEALLGETITMESYSPEQIKVLAENLRKDKEANNV